MSFFSFRRAPPGPIEPEGLSGPDAREAWRLYGLRPGPTSRKERFARLAQLLTRVTLDDCVLIGLLKRREDRFGVGSFGEEADGTGAGTLTRALSPGGRHWALSWMPAGGNGSDLWVDGREVGGPRDAHGLLPMDGGGWCGERIYLADIVPEDHPLQDWAVPFSQGVQRSALLVDVVTGRQWIERPADDELWSVPIGRESAGELLLYADDQARDAGRVARRVPLDKA